MSLAKPPTQETLSLELKLGISDVKCLHSNRFHTDFYFGNKENLHQNWGMIAKQNVPYITRLVPFSECSTPKNTHK